MDETIDGVNEVAQTVLGTEVVVLLATVILLMGIGIIIVLWFNGRSSKTRAEALQKQIDSQIEQTKLFNNALANAGNLNMQLLTANSQNVATLDKIGDQVEIIGNALLQQQSFHNESLALLQSQETIITEAIETAHNEHVDIVQEVKKVSDMNGEIMAAIKELQNQLSNVETRLDGLCQSDAATDEQIQMLIQQIVSLNKNINELMKITGSATDETSL